MNYILLFLFYFIGIITGIVIYYLNKKLFSKKSITKNVSKSHIDELTSAYNRTEFLKDLESAKAMMLIDIDDFSIINDIYTREVGDEILKKFVYHLKNLNSLKEYKIYRLGGDEFAILANEEAELKSIAQDIIKMVESFYLLKDKIPIQINVTIAVSYEKPLLETADIALKYAKRQEEKIVVFSHILEEDIDHTYFLEIVSRIKKAIQNDNIEPFFQCVKNRDGEIIQYEALIRIKEGEKYINPIIFLNIAKQAKLYNELTKHMIKKTFNYMKKKNTPFSINLSVSDISNINVRELLLEKIDEMPIKSNISIEFPDIELVKNFDKIKEFISILKEKGIKITIDDFGDSYSNFLYLEKLNVDMIKIDSGVVNMILSNPNAEFLVKTIVDFCNQNNIISVAKHVNHIEIYKKLKTLDVDGYQGFYFCKPQKDIE